MTIRLDHTIVPARDKLESARFFAEIFGLAVKPGSGHFAQVQINDSLTFDFADDPDSDIAPDMHHYAFCVSDGEFDAIFERIRRRDLAYGSGPFDPENGEIYELRGGRGLYFKDPSGHLLEIMTVAETGS